MQLVFLFGRCFSSTGGIQTLNRKLIAAVSSSSRHRADIIVRFDRCEDVPAGPDEDVMACAGSLLKTVISAARVALSAARRPWICDHLNYAPLAWLFSRGNYLVYTHAYELTLPVSRVRSFALKRARGVICISDHCRQLVLKLGVSAEKIIMMPHGADFKVLDGEKSKPPCILFLGRLDRHYKGQGHLLEAAAILKERNVGFEMRFAGGGDKLEFFRGEAKRLGVADSTHFLGFIGDDELDREFTQASIFAMPSNGEGFGLVYLQAMANGLPCICGNDDAGKEVVEHERTGFAVPYADPKALADALQRLIEDPGLRTELGEAGRIRYRENYTKVAFESRFLTFLDAL